MHGIFLLVVLCVNDLLLLFYFAVHITEGVVAATAHAIGSAPAHGV